MASVEKSIEVNVPVSTAYNQWTQFESFPQFMEGVEQVQQLDDTRLHWKATIAGKTEEWDAQITEQVPNQVIAWRATSGAQNDGRIVFQAMGDSKTRIDVRFDYEPEGAVEKVGSAVGVVDRRVKGDLDNFKKFIEERGAATGAWLGEVHGGQAESTS